MKYEPVKYELGKDGECITPCPFGVGHSDEDYESFCQFVKMVFPKAKKIEKVFFVNAGFCQECEHYCGSNDQKGFVLCSYNSKK